jgi:hypothetical protein
MRDDEVAQQIGVIADAAAPELVLGIHQQLRSFIGPRANDEIMRVLLDRSAALVSMYSTASMLAFDWAMIRTAGALDRSSKPE